MSKIFPGRYTAATNEPLSSFDRDAHQSDCTGAQVATGCQCDGADAEDALQVPGRKLSGGGSTSLARVAR